MTQTVEGYVQKIHAKSGQGKKGPWTRYSALVNDEWFVVGFDAPKFKEGDNVRLGYEDSQYGKEIKGSKVLAAGEAPPAAASKATGSGNRGMAWGNACNVTAQLLASMIQVDALPLSVAKDKAGQVKRHNEFMLAFNKLRVQLYNDAEDIDRVIASVADAGEVKEIAPTPLPEAAPEEDDDVTEEWD